jgi:hypothetical protein
MKRISVKKLFNMFCLVFVLSFFFLVIFNVAKFQLPANRLTHECKPPPIILLNATAGYKEEDDEQGFCKQYDHTEFKDSLDRSVNNTGVPILLISGFILIPLSSILIYRWFTAKR